MSRQLSFLFFAVIATFLNVAPTRAEPLGNASSFLQAIQQNDGKVPYPLEDLLKYLYSKDLDADGTRQIQIALVPKGRSLHRDQADFKNPRIISGFGELAPTFVGFVPKTEQLEVMSFNRQTAQYDFYVVSEYKQGGTPKVKFADRELCLQCHQHGGPIFSRSPWREMRERNPGTEEAFYKQYGYGNDIPSHDKDENLLAKEILAARGGDAHYYGIDLNDYINEEDSKWGHFTRGPAASFAFYLRLQNWSYQMHRVALAACGEDVGCRATVLRLALIFPSFEARAIANGMIYKVKPAVEKYSKTIENAVNKYWPEDGYAYPSPVLPDRKFLGKGNDQYVGYVIRPLVNGTDVTYYEMLGDYVPSEFYYLADHNLVDLGGKPWKSFHEVEVTDPKVLDPKTPRPRVMKIPLNKAGEFLLTNSLEGLNFSPTELNLLRALNFTKLEEVLKNKKYEAFAHQWPPDVHNLMTTILEDMGLKDKAKVYLASLSKPTVVPESVLKTIPSAQYRASNNLFVRYCASCHHGGGEEGDLPLDNLEQLSKTSSVCRVLQSKKMPPPTQRKWQPSSEERAEMLKTINCSVQSPSPIKN